MFELFHPENISRWFKQIGHVNVQLIRSIRLSISYFHYGCASNWRKAVRILAVEASGLRHLEVEWRIGCYRELEAGRDVGLVRAVAKIRNLSSMTVGGFYAKSWPAYLNKEMGVVLMERTPSVLSLKSFQECTKELSP